MLFVLIKNRKLLHLILALLIPVSYAQTALEYQYDGAGNVIHIRSDGSQGQPLISDLQPPYLLKNRTTIITASGLNLSATTVSSATHGVNVLAFQNLSDQRLILTVRADQDAAVGLATLTFSNDLGSGESPLSVLPLITTDPSPLILAPDDQATRVQLIIEARDSDHTYALSIQQTPIASVAETDVTLAGGDTQAPITLSGHSIGMTSLNIRIAPELAPLPIPLIVTDAQLPAGGYTVTTRAVGVALYAPQAVTTQALTFSSPVGLSIYSPQAVTTQALTHSAPIGVVISPPSHAEINSVWVSPMIGVERQP